VSFASLPEAFVTETTFREANVVHGETLCVELGKPNLFQRLNSLAPRVLWLARTVPILN